MVGAGFAGLLLWYKLREAGFDDVRFCEKGGDVGGTWYWNRYPGIACDVESYSYLPLLEEMGYVPTMKFASGFEILEYCQKMAEQFGFYDHCLFHTTVERTEWDEDAGRWTVHTDRGDAMRARFVILANGILTSPKLARIEGMETFQGESFHTSRWDYDVDLDGKRVGIIGTGATAVQAIPELAKVAGELYVFQRTPSTIDVRDQRATTAGGDRDLGATSPAGRRARRARFAKISAGRTAIKANDDYLAGKVADFKERKAARARAVAGGADRRSSSTRTSGSWSRSAPGSTPSSRTRRPPRRSSRTTPTAASGRRSTTSTCRRSTCRTCTSSTPRRSGVTRDQRARRRARRRRVPARRADLRDRLPVDGDVDVQHDRRPRRPHAQREVADRGHQDVPRPAQPRLPEPVHRDRPAGRRRQLQLHRRHRRPRRLRRVDAVDDARAGRTTSSTSTQEPEDAYAEHCREADIATAPLRDCLSYYNGHGDAAPGSLAYYGGGNWHKWRDRGPGDAGALRLRSRHRLTDWLTVRGDRRVRTGCVR